MLQQKNLPCNNQAKLHLASKISGRNHRKVLSHLVCEINDMNNGFSVFGFNAAHSFHNNLIFCVYCHFNDICMKFIDIMYTVRSTNYFLCLFNYN